MSSAVASAVRERPIIFSGEMVRAILDGRKTQTRRVIQPQPEKMDLCDDEATRGPKVPHWCMYPDSWDAKKRTCWPVGDEPYWQHCPYGVPGDRLWVRETWLAASSDGDHGWSVLIPTGHKPDRIFYRATDDIDGGPNEPQLSWHASIHMPRWASRLTLELTDVRVERVQEISSTDAWQEGVRAHGVSEHAGDGYGDSVEPEGAVVAAYAALWDSLNAKRGYSWESNPWVWVLSFRKASVPSLEVPQAGDEK